MRVLVCGGRDFATNDKWDEVNFFYHEMYKITDRCSTDDLVIIQGGAHGADYRAKEFAREHGIRYEELRADWERYGKRAGYLRNKQMLDEGSPDLVVAFPGGKGTANMVRLAREAGVPVREIVYRTEQMEEEA